MSSLFLAWDRLMIRLDKMGNLINLDIIALPLLGINDIYVEILNFHGLGLPGLCSPLDVILRRRLLTGLHGCPEARR